MTAAMGYSAAVSDDDERRMRLAIEQGDLARGTTGNNPWVGCTIISSRGELLGLGHTQGPGEDHAEIAAARYASERGLSIIGATLYSTLEPCSFHGRTPACAKAIPARGIARVVIAMRGPHPRVSGWASRCFAMRGCRSSRACANPTSGANWAPGSSNTTPTSRSSARRPYPKGSASRR